MVHKQMLIKTDFLLQDVLVTLDFYCTHIILCICYEFNFDFCRYYEHQTALLIMSHVLVTIEGV
jgi:hypothetical protein